MHRCVVIPTYCQISIANQRYYANRDRNRGKEIFDKNSSALGKFRASTCCVQIELFTGGWEIHGIVQKGLDEGVWDNGELPTNTNPIWIFNF